MGIVPSGQFSLHEEADRLELTVAGAISLWRALGQALAGMMLICMCGLVLLSAPSQGGMQVIGGALGVLGLVLLGHAAFRATRTVQSGAFSSDAAGATPFDEARDATRFAPATGTTHGSMGVFALVRRTDLAFGLVFFAIGAGVMVLMVRVAVEGSVPAALLVGLLFAAVGGFLVWQSVKKIVTWRAIQASPVSAEAIVQEIRSVSSKPLRYALEYRYQDAAGGHHLGLSFPLTPSEAGPWRRFDVAAILVNRDRPEQSMLAELRPIRRSTREERSPDGDPKGSEPPARGRP